MATDFREEWRQLEQEHAHLHTLYGALECTVDRVAALHTIGDLEKWVSRHFLREEREGGVLASIVGHEEEVQAVYEEHAAILAVLTETRSLLEHAEALGADTVREATALLGATLRSHERREHALVEAYLRELGARP